MSVREDSLNIVPTTQRSLDEIESFQNIHKCNQQNTLPNNAVMLE